MTEIASLESATATFVNQVIHAELDPLVALRIFREKKSDTVCIKINHSVCDAGGLKEYVGLLSDLYSMLITCGRRSIQPNFDRRDQSQIFERTKDQLSLIMRSFPRPTWTLPQKLGIEPLHSFRVISQPQFEAIKKYAHDMKASVNDVLLTALYRTLFSVNDTVAGKPMMIQVSIDLRRYLTERRAEAICNLSGALYVALERIIEEPFEGTLGRVVAMTSKLKLNYPGLESAAGLEYLYSQGFTAMEKYMAESAEMGRKYNVTFPLLSNFGVLEAYHFGELQVTKGYMTSPIIYQPGLMLGATTFKKEMTFSIGYCGQGNTQKIESFLDAYITQITK